MCIRDSKASLWTVGIWGLLISAVFICIPEPIARIFFYEPKAIATSVEYLIIIGFSEAFMCVEPVSYTNLDVYKRQIWLCGSDRANRLSVHSN